MAIGDAVSQVMGTAETDRQPSSGVEEQISAIAKPSGTDECGMYNGSALIEVITNTARTSLTSANANAANPGFQNMAHMITNTVYFRKAGTTDYIVLMGVQTNV